MKKLLFLLFPVVIFAQSFMLSNIPLPKTYIQNLDPYECDRACMQEYLDNGLIFSFLAHAYKKLEDVNQNETRVMFISIFNLGSAKSGTTVRIALLLPYKKIGKYAASTTNSTFAYMMTKSHPFIFKSYNVEDETVDSMQKALDTIRADGFNYIIAPVTMQGANSIIEINPSLNIYFPTINKRDVNTTSTTLYFGAIDYNTQSNLLLKEAFSPLVIFSDKSTTGKKLALYQENEFLNPTIEIETEIDDSNSSSFFGEIISVFSQMDEAEVDTDIVDLNNTQEEESEEKTIIKYFISRKTTNLEPYLKENEDIKQGSFFLNTPIIKSGMIMSQLTLYDVNATNILSTQINYDPLLLSMTQYIDRKDMVIANSITEHNNVLIETNSLLSNDIVYDWINYTTTIGVDYFYFLMTSEDKIYNTKMIDNQMIYNTELLQPSRSKFIPYIRPYREPRVIDELEKNIILEEGLEETQE